MILTRLPIPLLLVLQGCLLFGLGSVALTPCTPRAEEAEVAAWSVTSLYFLLAFLWMVTVGGLRVMRERRRAGTEAWHRRQDDRLVYLGNLFLAGLVVVVEALQLLVLEEPIRSGPIAVGLMAVFFGASFGLMAMNPVLAEKSGAEKSGGGQSGGARGARHGGVAHGGAEARRGKR